MIIRTFWVDSAEYRSAQHECVLITKEYTYGKIRMTQQTVHEALMKQILQKLQFADDFRLDRVRYFYTDLEEQSRTELPCGLFSEILGKFPPDGVRASEEYCELYDYQDKSDQHAQAWITVAKETDTPMRAKIDFKTSGDWENFVPPPWLYPAGAL